MDESEREIIHLLFAALKDLIETANAFADQRGSEDEKALWSDIQWAKAQIQKVPREWRGDE